MITERQHWLSITDDPGWKRNCISDPNISLTETVDAIVSAFPLKPERIVEIGCGYGRLTREIRARYPDADVFGMDINPVVLAEAGEYDPGTLFVLASSMQFAARIDAAYSVAVFQHLPRDEKRRYIRDSFDALNPGGVLRIQFIEGVRDIYLDHWVTGEQMVLWAHNAGFTTRVQRGLVHPQWTWLTCIK